MTELFRYKNIYSLICRYSRISWQELVDNYRTFAAEIESDVKQVRELLDDTGSTESVN